MLLLTTSFFPLASQDTQAVPLGDTAAEAATPTDAAGVEKAAATPTDASGAEEAAGATIAWESPRPAALENEGPAAVKADLGDLFSADTDAVGEAASASRPGTAVVLMDDSPLVCGTHSAVSLCVILILLVIIMGEPTTQTNTHKHVLTHTHICTYGQVGNTSFSGGTLAVRPPALHRQLTVGMPDGEWILCVCVRLCVCDRDLTPAEATALDRLWLAATLK